MLDPPALFDCCAGYAGTRYMFSSVRVCPGLHCAEAIARCPEEMDVDGGTTPACMLLEPVGRTLADRLSHMAAEPLAPQEQVRHLSCAAAK